MSKKQSNPPPPEGVEKPAPPPPPPPPSDKVVSCEKCGHFLLTNGKCSDIYCEDFGTGMPSDLLVDHHDYIAALEKSLEDSAVRIKDLEEGGAFREEMLRQEVEDKIKDCVGLRKSIQPLVDALLRICHISTVGSLCWVTARQALRKTGYLD